MRTVLRAISRHSIGGIPHEILCDRMKTDVIGEAGGGIAYNRALIDFAHALYRWSTARGISSEAAPLPVISFSSISRGSGCWEYDRRIE
ncbi:hypothetical protein [Bradyrhizobium sp. URHC0002]